MTLTGRLLVATPLLLDPNFNRTVILMLEHGESGALGVVVNRPSEADLSDALPVWKPFAASPSVVFRGGPVAPGAAIALGRMRRPPESAGLRVVFDDIAIVDLGLDPDELAGDLVEIRVFAGYAGWDAQQLEGEIAAHAWFVLDRAHGDPFTADPYGQWRSVLRRQRGRPRLFAHFPDDPSRN